MAIETRRGPYRRRSGESSKKEVKVRYYNFSIPEGLYKAVGNLAAERGSTFREALIHLVALGLTTNDLTGDPSVSLTIHYGDGEVASVSWGWNAYLTSVFPSDRS